MAISDASDRAAIIEPVTTAVQGRESPRWPCVGCVHVGAFKSALFAAKGNRHEEEP